MKKLFDHRAFKKAIKESGLTKAALAKKIGCHPAELLKYEKGLIAPRHDRLKKMVEILGPEITGLSTSSLPIEIKEFKQNERKFLIWFASLPHDKKCRVLGFCQAVATYETFDIDPEFAGNLSEQLAHALQQQSKEQSG